MTCRKLTVLILILIQLFVPVALATDAIEYTYTLTYSFENRGTEPLELNIEELTMPLFQNNEYQTITIINNTHEYIAQSMDIDNNLGAIMQIDRTLDPDETLTFSITYRIEAQSRPQPKIEFTTATGYRDIPEDLISQYTSPSETFTSDDPEIIELARQITRNEETVLSSVTRMIDWVTKNTTYRNFELPQYPSKTLLEGLGDCDDQSMLLITMSRSLGIPAYMEVGIIINPSLGDNNYSWEDHLRNEQDGVGWHGWAMIYIPPYGWTPIDLTLVQADSGLEYIQQAPEYGNNIITAFTVSQQEYIGDAIKTRERIINSDLYVTVKDQATVNQTTGLPLQSMLIIGLGIGVTAALAMMFLSEKRKNQ